MSDMHKHCNDYVGEMRDRIAQLEAELAEARKQQKYAWERHAEKDRAYGEALAARDAERAAHARTQAEAAAMRVEREMAQADAIEMHRALSWPCTCRGRRSCRRCLAMDGKAGRALAERVKLWRELEAAARELRGHEATACVIDPPCTNCSACRFNASIAALEEEANHGTVPHL